jgi:protein O-mannosyl-transferase
MKQTIFRHASSFLGDAQNSTMLVALALILLTLIAYYPLRKNDFVNYDDPAYVYSNQRVSKGLTASNVAWAFKTTHLTNWHPLTWLSHMADVQLFGLRPAGHHATSFLLHVVNVLLLFFLLSEMMGQMWPSAFVAAVFGVHPLNVESVAWVSERKNVLSTSFLLLTIWAYVRYVRQSGWKRYALVIGLFIVGLMTKPMLVTLPFILLVLDFWPLGRMKVPKADISGREEVAIESPERPEVTPLRRRDVVHKLVVEKLPLIALSFVSAVITLKASSSGGAMMPTRDLPILDRLSNTITSYAAYLYQLLWPARLAPFYPHPGPSISHRAVLISTVLVAGISIVIVWTTWSKRSFHWMITGWLWFLGTLVPVIGLIQVGGQARADRYAYVPMIGILIIVAWSVQSWTRRLPQRKYWLSGIAICVLLALTFVTRQQVRYWQNGSELWTRTLQVTEGNYVAHTNLAIYLVAFGKYDQAIDQCNLALQIVPRDALTYETLGEALSKKGKPDEGIPHLYRALRLTEERETAISAQRALGDAMVQIGNEDKAVHHYSQTLRLDAQNLEAHARLAALLYKRKEFDKATFHYFRAAQISSDAGRYIKLASVLWEQGKLQQATRFYSRALDLEPNSVEAQRSLDTLKNTGTVKSSP